MHYPKLVLHLFLLFLIFTSLSFCREKKTGFVNSMNGATVYKCDSEYNCSKDHEAKKIPYGTQIEYLTRPIESEKEKYFIVNYKGETIFLKQADFDKQLKKIFFKILPIDGASLYSVKNKNTKLLIIQHGEIVEFLGFNEYDYYEVKYKDQIGFISKYKLAEENEKVKFKVAVFSGLNLRELPNPKSKIITTLPYETVGEVLEMDKIIYTIQNKKGYWIKTTYENETGWIFSAFVFLRTEKFDFPHDNTYGESDFYHFFTNLEDMESLSFGLQRLNTDKKIPSQLSEFYFLEQRSKEKEPEDHLEVIQLYLVNENRNLVYNINDGEENFIKVDHGKFFIIRTDGCHFCCPYQSDRLFFVLKNKLKYIYMNEDSHSCGTSSYMKFSKVNSILYIRADYGECEKNYSAYVPELHTLTGPPLIFKSYTHDMFIKIKINEDDLDIKRIIDKGIPAEYKQEWEEAEEIWKKN